MYEPIKRKIGWNPSSWQRPRNIFTFCLTRTISSTTLEAMEKSLTPLTGNVSSRRVGLYLLYEKCTSKWIHCNLLILISLEYIWPYTKRRSMISEKYYHRCCCSAFAVVAVSTKIIGPMFFIIALNLSKI